MSGARKCSSEPSGCWLVSNEESPSAQATLNGGMLEGICCTSSGVFLWRLATAALEDPRVLPFSTKRPVPGHAAGAFHFSGANMKVQVFEHDGCLIMNPTPVKPTKHWHPTGAGGATGPNSRFGCVLIDSKKRLECSQEAIDLMRTMHHNGDCMGDIDWHDCKGKWEGQWAFSWIGSIFKVMRVRDNNLSLARGAVISEDNCTIIPNAPTPPMILGVEGGGWDWRTPGRWLYDD